MKVNLLDYISNPDLLNDPSDKEIKVLYRQVQDYFYQFNNSEWSLMKCAKFVKENELEPTSFLIFLESLFYHRFPYTIGRNGRKGAFDFIQRLNKSPRFRKKENNPDKLKFEYNESEYIEFLNDLRNFKNKYLPDSTHIDWLSFLYNHFETNKTWSVFKRDYSDFKSN